VATTTQTITEGLTEVEEAIIEEVMMTAREIKGTQ
jgi:hypothetical protein